MPATQLIDEKAPSGTGRREDALTFFVFESHRSDEAVKFRSAWEASAKVGHFQEGTKNST